MKSQRAVGHCKEKSRPRVFIRDDSHDGMFSLNHPGVTEYDVPSQGKAGAHGLQIITHF